MLRNAQMLAFVLLALAASAAGARPDRDGEADRKQILAALDRSLRDVINEGAALYNRGNQSDCYRLYEGALVTARGLLSDCPKLQRAIDDSLAKARLEGCGSRGAFTLRAALDQIRSELSEKKEKDSKGKGKGKGRGEEEEKELKSGPSKEKRTADEGPGISAKSGIRIADLAGKWRITYSHGAVRDYIVEKDGRVSFPEESLRGRIERKSGGLRLSFDGDNRPERLTPGVDGRLFVEHYASQSDFADGKPVHLGIGVRQD